MRSDPIEHPNDIVHSFMAGFCRIGYDETGALCNVNYYDGAQITPPGKRKYPAEEQTGHVATSLTCDCVVVVRMNTLTEDERDCLTRFWHETRLFPSEAAMVARLTVCPRFDFSRRHTGRQRVSHSRSIPSDAHPDSPNSRVPRPHSS